jgi:hypothetical protein
MPDSKARGVSNLPAAIPDVPDAPTVSATNVGTSRAYNNGAATVSFSSPTGGRPSSYSITTTPTTSTTTATTSPATITGLSSATSYTATVTPSNISATGASTTTDAFTATTVPQAPTIGTFTDGGDGASGTLSFTAGATGGSSITGYKYSTDGTNYSSASGTTSPLTISGLSVGSYTFYLKATNANGDSAASSGVSGTVLFPYESAYDALGTITVPSGGAASVTLSGIPTGYKHLQLRVIGRTNRANVEDGLYIRFNGDTSGSYNAHVLRGNGTNASSFLATTTTDTKIESYGMPGNSATSGIFGAAVMDLLDYTDTNKKKVTRMLTGDDRNGSGWIELNSGLWNNTSAVTSITLFAIGSWLEYSQFALYGVK